MLLFGQPPLARIKGQMFCWIYEQSAMPNSEVCFIRNSQQTCVKVTEGRGSTYKIIIAFLDDGKTQLSPGILYKKVRRFCKTRFALMTLTPFKIDGVESFEHTERL